MNDGSSPRRIADIDMQPAGNEMLVHDLQHANVHVLNATAARVLELCDGAHTVAAIAQTVAAEFGADAATVASDVEAVLANFRDLGLLEALTTASA